MRDVSRRMIRLKERVRERCDRRPRVIVMAGDILPPPAACAAHGRRRPSLRWPLPRTSLDREHVA